MSCVDLFLVVFQRVSYSGGNRVYIRSNLPSPFGVAVVSGSIYWIDRNLKQVALVFFLMHKLHNILIITIIMFK